MAIVKGESPSSWEEFRLFDETERGKEEAPPDDADPEPETTEATKLWDHSEPEASKRRCDLQRICLYAFATTILVVFGLSWLEPRLAKVSSGCSLPVERYEWRQLSREDRVHYLTAVQCLHEHPSVLHDNSTAHDDFAWIHVNVGAYCVYLVT